MRDKKGVVPSSQALGVLLLVSVGEGLSYLQTGGHGVDGALPAQGLKRQAAALP